MLGKWDNNGLDFAREKIFQWRIVGYGQEDERAECERCGAAISKSVYKYRHSLLLACPKCRTALHGFFTREQAPDR